MRRITLLSFLFCCLAVAAGENPWKNIGDGDTVPVLVAGKANVKYNDVLIRHSCFWVATSADTTKYYAQCSRTSDTIRMHVYSKADNKHICDQSVYLRDDAEARRLKEKAEKSVFAEMNPKYPLTTAVARHGIQNQYKDGLIRCTEKYSNDTLLHIVWYDKAGRPQRDVTPVNGDADNKWRVVAYRSNGDTVTLRQPQYPTGIEGLQAYFDEHFVLTGTLFDNYEWKALTGSVGFEFLIDETGKVNDVKLTAKNFGSVGAKLTKEQKDAFYQMALDCIKQDTTTWIPGTMPDGPQTLPRTVYLKYRFARK